MRSIRNKNIAYLYVLPASLFLLAIFIYPLFYGLYLSLHSTKEGFANLIFVGLKNYIDAFKAGSFWVSFNNTIIYTIASVITTVLLGFIVAVLLDRIKKGAIIYRVLLILPLGIAPVVSGSTWAMMMNPLTGIINYILGILNLPEPLWHTGFSTAMLSVIIIETWQWTPFPLFIIYSGLQMVPDEPLEAAEIDGASFLQRLRYIIIPLTWPIIAIAIIFRVIGASRSFDIIYAVTKGGPGYATETFIIQAYQASFRFYNIERGLVIASILFIITIISSYFLIRISKQRS